MFVVTGATGNTGGATARALLAAGLPVRVFVRDAGRASRWVARGAEAAVGDLAAASTMARAFDGAEAVFVLNPPAYPMPDLFTRARTLAFSIREAVRRARPGRLVVLSSIGAHLSFGTGIIETNRRFEEVLGDVSCPVTFLRPSFFYENWVAGLESAARDGCLPSFLSPLDRAIPMVGAVDIGAAAAAAMRDPDAPRLVELTGPRDYSPQDAAAACSEALGRPVTAVEIPEAAWGSVLAGIGFSRRTIEGWRELFQGFNSGRIRFASARSKVERGMTKLEDVLPALAASHAPAMASG